MKTREKLFKSKKIVVITALLLAAVLILSFFSNKTEESGGRSEEEILEGRLAELCERISGVRKAYVMATLSYDDTDGSYSLFGTEDGKNVNKYKVVGVGVVFTGDGGASTLYEVSEMVSRVLDIPINHVKVVNGGH